jgi:hypothetical protein
MTFFSILPVFHESYGSQSACFSNAASATFTRNTVDTPVEPFFGLVHMREFLRVCFVLKTVPVLYLLGMCLNFSEIFPV